MRRECTTVKFFSCGEHIGTLEAFDQHGNGRRNKVWDGHVYGIPVELNNFKEVSAFAKAKGYELEKVYDEEHDALCSDYHGPSAPCIIR